MASGRRSKLQEKLLSIHKNLEWIKQHINDCIALNPENHHNLNVFFSSLEDMAMAMDGFVQDVYGKL